MEKLIARWSYWLGIACLIVAVLWRVLNAFGFWAPLIITPGRTIWYLSFLHASILFFVAAIATACYTWINSQKV